MFPLTAEAIQKVAVPVQSAIPPALAAFFRRGGGRNARRSFWGRVRPFRLRRDARFLPVIRSDPGESARRVFQGAFHIRRAQGGQTVQQGQAVARLWKPKRVLQMQNFGHGIQFAHLQEHDLTPGRPVRAPDRETQPLAGLGLAAQADPQAAQRQIFQHNAAILKNAGKGHDAAFAADARPAPPLRRHIGGQTGAGHEQARLLKHGQHQFRPLHILGIKRVAGAEQGAHGLSRQRAGQVHGFHAVQGRAGQLAAGPAPAGGQQQSQLMAPHTGGQHV